MKKKFIYSLSAFALACILSFSSIGGSFIQVHASSSVSDALWNTDESDWANISKYLRLFASFIGVYTNPNLSNGLYSADSVTQFLDYMISDADLDKQSAHDVLCGCGNVYSSCPAFVEDGDVPTFDITLFKKGGGGHVRDGISMDEDGNVTYSDEVSDLFHGFITNLLDSNSGYFLYKSKLISDISPTSYATLDMYNDAVDIFNSLEVFYYDGLTELKYGDSYGFDTVMMSSQDLDFDDLYFVFYTNNGDSDLIYPYYKSTWNKVPTPYIYYYQYDFTSSVFNYVQTDGFYTYYTLGTKKGIYSIDGRYIKIFKDVDAMKLYECNRQPYYATDSFYNYDSTIDNSTTITSQEYAYYNDNSTTIYQTIQNNIDNSGNDSLTEKDVQDIVDAAVQEMKDTIANSGDQGGNDSADSDNGGNGVGDLVGGIGKLLDTILSLIGKVMGIVADFTQSILDLFTGFTDFTDGFSNFLSGAFSFIPQEIWNVIQVGLSLTILLAVIKFLRK